MRKPVSVTTVHPNPKEGGGVSILFAGYSQTEPLHRMGPQVLDYILVHTIMEGKGMYRCRGTDYELGGGDHFFIFPGELHTYQADKDEPWRYRWVAFRGPEAERWLVGAGISPERPVLRGGEEVPLKAESAIQRIFRDGHWTADWEAQGWLRLAFAAWARQSRPEGPPKEARAGRAAREADRAARWLQAQLANPVTIEEMAKELGYHRTHLSKLFRAEMGMTPIEYLQRLRIERAQLLLGEPLTVEEVASAVGFADPLYFSKSFKRWTGMTPTAYRKSLK